MSDEIVNEGNVGGQEEVPKEYSKEDVAKIVQDRLRNMHAEKEELQKQLEAFQNAQAESEAPSQPAPTLAEGGAGEPLTEARMQQMLEAQHEKSQEAAQQAQAQQALNYHIQNLRKMEAEDPDFAKLNKNSTLGVPAEVAVHLSNSLAPAQTKRLFKELLTNETSNLKMQNAYLSGQYEQWLEKALASPELQSTAPDPVPDLSKESGEAVSTPSYENTMNYLKSLS